MNNEENFEDLNFSKPVFRDVTEVDTEYEEDHDHTLDIKSQMEKDKKEESKIDLDDEEYADINYDLTPEDIARRNREFDELSNEGKEMFNEIIGKRNTRIIHLDVLVENSVDAVEEYSDDIDELDFSLEYMTFLSWFTEQKRNQNLYNLYSEQEIIFENILNSGLETEDPNSLFDIMTKKELENNGIIQGEEKPMSALVEEASERFTILSCSEVDLVELFINIEIHKDKKWEEFKVILEG